MDIRTVIRQLGLLLLVLSACMCLVTLVELVTFSSNEMSERLAVRALLSSAGLGGVLGLVLWLIGRPIGESFLGRREALLLVALSWFIGAALGGLPFYLWEVFGGAGSADSPGHIFGSPAASYFEAMSGLTTTGATVLSDIQALPKALLLWRCMTHWLGGLGIVVLFVAVLPTLGVGGKKLYQAEAPTPQATGVRPRIRETARTLWLIYFGLTIAQIIALRLAGMNWFNAVCHTFSTLATGGFSNWNASIGHYADNVAIQIIVIIFMVLAGINFGLYYHLIRRRFREVVTDPELQAYLGIMLIATVLICISIYGQSIVLTTGETVTYGFFGYVLTSLFQAVTMHTGTGFCTVDFNLWSFFPHAIIVTLMFVGASTGSTGGGLKVIRVLIAFRILIAQIERTFRPTVIRPIKIGRTFVDDEIQRGILTYIITVFVLFFIGGVLLMLFEADHVTFFTAATASAATLNNVGPGLGLVGPVENYGFFTDPSLLVLCLLMALGRLEVYAIAVLFLPSFWRQD